MKDLEAKAQEAVPAVQFKNADGTCYEVIEFPLYEHDDIGTDEYPTFGDFLHCYAVNGDGDRLGERYLEVPGALANELLEIDAEAGTAFRLARHVKTDDGQWAVDIEELQHD